MNNNINLLDLPEEIINIIIKYLSGKNLICISSVSKLLYEKSRLIYSLMTNNDFIEKFNIKIRDRRYELQTQDIHLEFEMMKCPTIEHKCHYRNGINTSTYTIHTNKRKYFYTRSRKINTVNCESKEDSDASFELCFTQLYNNGQLNYIPEINSKLVSYNLVIEISNKIWINNILKTYFKCRYKDIDIVDDVKYFVVCRIKRYHLKMRVFHNKNHKFNIIILSSGRAMAEEILMNRQLFIYINL